MLTHSYVFFNTDVAPPTGGAVTPSRMMESRMLSPAADGEKLVPGPVEVDMRHYNSLMSVVPLESTSIALMMHCMLEQV